MTSEQPSQALRASPVNDEEAEAQRGEPFLSCDPDEVFKGPDGEQMQPHRCQDHNLPPTPDASLLARPTMPRSLSGVSSIPEAPIPFGNKLLRQPNQFTQEAWNRSSVDS